MNALYDAADRQTTVAGWIQRATDIYVGWCEPKTRRFLRMYHPEAGECLAKEIESVEAGIRAIETTSSDHSAALARLSRTLAACRTTNAFWLAGGRPYDLRRKITPPKRF